MRDAGGPFTCLIVPLLQGNISQCSKEPRVTGRDGGRLLVDDVEDPELVLFAGLVELL